MNTVKWIRRSMFLFFHIIQPGDLIYRIYYSSNSGLCIQSIQVNGISDKAMILTYGKPINPLCIGDLHKHSSRSGLYYEIYAYKGNLKHCISHIKKIVNRHLGINLSNVEPISKEWFNA